MLIIRCWSKSNSTNRIWWTIKKLDAEDNATDAGDNDQLMFVLTILEKIKEARKCDSVTKDGELSGGES